MKKTLFFLFSILVFILLFVGCKKIDKDLGSSSSVNTYTPAENLTSSSTISKAESKNDTPSQSVKEPTSSISSTTEKSPKKKKSIKKIVDESDGYTLTQAFEEFYRDDNYRYLFSCGKSSVVIVYYNNGAKQNVKEALEKGKIEISDLDKWDIKYFKQPIEDDTNSSKPN